MSTSPTPPFSVRCRVLRWHHWATAHNPDGEPYRECTRCGAIQPRYPFMQPMAG